MGVSFVYILLYYFLSSNQSIDRWAGFIHLKLFPFTSDPRLFLWLRFSIGELNFVKLFHVCLC